MLVFYMNMSTLTEYYMEGIISYFECMNEYGFMQRCYINGGGGLRKREKASVTTHSNFTLSSPSCLIKNHYQSGDIDTSMTKS